MYVHIYEYNLNFMKFCTFINTQTPPKHTYIQKALEGNTSKYTFFFFVFPCVFCVDYKKDVSLLFTSED